MLNYLKRMPNYVSAFGLWPGLRLQKASSAPQRDDTLRLKKLVAPGYQNPMYLRHTRSDGAAFWQNIVTTQYEFSKFPHAQTFAQSVDRARAANAQLVFVDCGANIGLASVWFKNEYPDAHIIAVEPDQDNYELCCKNLANYGDVKIHHAGVGSRAGKLVIKDPSVGSMSFETEFAFDDRADTIECLSLNTLLDNVIPHSVVVVKVDIEGSQADLFSKNLEWIDCTALLMIEIEDWKYPWEKNSKNLWKVIADNDFDVLIKGENLICFSHRFM